MAAGLRRKRRQASAQKACGRVPWSVSSKPMAGAKSSGGIGSGIAVIGCGSAGR